MNAVYANSCPRPVFSQQRASSQAVLHILRLEFKQQEQRTVIRNPRLTTLPVSSPPRPMPHYMQLPPCLLCTGGLKISGLVPNCQPTAAAVKHQGRTAGRSSSNNREARASAAARGVSLFFWRFFGQKPENLEFCVVIVNKTMFRRFCSIVVCSCFFVTCLRKCRKYRAVRLLFVDCWG